MLILPQIQQKGAGLLVARLDRRIDHVNVEKIDGLGASIRCHHILPTFYQLQRSCHST
jgi:hypothetical protein